MERSWFARGDGDRDPRLGWFASGGKLDGAPPSARMLGVLERLALLCGPGHPGHPGGPGGGGVPFAGATHDEAAGMLAAAAAVESHAAAVKLAVVREIIRRHAPAVPGGRMPDPASWDIGVLHEVAAILRVSVQSAGPVVELAWQLAARIPGVGALLDIGVLSSLTVKIIAEEFSVLEGEKLAEAEKRLLEHDLAADDMTPGKIRRLCQRIADTTDPEGAARRRERKERDEARVRFFRGHGGAGALFAAGLPPDEALKSEANVQKRALEYKGAGIREKMDFLRVLALVDLTNGVTAPTRVALWQAEQAERQQSGVEDPGRRAWEEEQQEEQAENAENADRARHGDRPPSADREPGNPSDRPSAEPPAPGRESPGGGGGGNGQGGAVAVPVPAGVSDPGLPALVNMTCPLATVMGQADRPGEAPGYGSLDPALVRRLADATAASARSEFCITFTDGHGHGHAAAHGCARLIRGTRGGGGTGNENRNETGTGDGGRTRNETGTRVGPPGGNGGNRGNGENSGNSGNGPPGAGWGFARDTARPGPEGGYGSWVLTLPGGAQTGGRRYRVEMHKIPLHDCDHQYATGAYRPGALLRHLVQVRDGECVFPGCSRPARESDFDHAVPYHKGGATDACNAGMRSRRCHKVKQSPGWNVTQPEPGWHTWTAPSGRDYTKGPKDYPA